MKILLTNDDGIDAPGLRTLSRTLTACNGFEVAVVAPERQRSGASRSVTIHHPVASRRRDLGQRLYALAVDGTPTDCVKLALRGGVLPFEPDLAISGINRGPNLGRDTLYSATVASAMEAAAFGIPSISASLASYDYEDYSDAAMFLARLIGSHADEFRRIGGTLNVNFPGMPASEWGGIRFCRLSETISVDSYESFELGGGTTWHMARETRKAPSSPDTDAAAVGAGFVTMTPLGLDFYDGDSLAIWSAAIGVHSCDAISNTACRSV